ncbi:DNA polymerase IV [Ornithinicoccus halotolerans]|uniref:DNA polymerase IV n=1 Tax=Ornithinicoccus halotolerans TaxID=1748220 RepID=UPI0012970A5C|nr:DNA polymerase IV [Ornithinicoccus halotolerans]
MAPVRSRARVVHLDLDAFFAAVEQRDKPSLRGRPVVVGGIGARGVVSTASYEARRYGARSAMPTHEARRLCPPGTAFLHGRYDAYRASSAVVMELLHEASPLVQQVSVDEAYLDLTDVGVDDSPEGLRAWGEELLQRIRAATGGLTASLGIATSKMMAKIGSEMHKPGGITVIPPGQEQAVLEPLPTRAVAGVGPATAARLHSFGVETVGDLARVSLEDLVAIFGQAHGRGLYELARARDDRPVTPERETKSLSAEETFPTDVTDRRALEAELEQIAGRLAARLGRAALFGRTVTVKVRLHDFTTMTRSGTLPYATGEAQVVLREARRLLAGVDVSAGVRLLGVGVSGLAQHAQEELVRLPESAWTGGAAAGDPWPDAVGAGDAGTAPEASSVTTLHQDGGWRTGQDVEHAEHGRGWVWGAGRRLVTVRFEGPLTPPGPIRSFALDDPRLRPADPPEWRLPESGEAAGAC